MELGLDTVWLAHPSFKCLSNNEKLIIREYFECTEQSGGGRVVDWRQISDQQGDTSALLVRFEDSQCVGRVCEREHCLGVIFASMSDKFGSMNQKIEARPHTTSDTGSQSSLSDSFVLVSECGDSSGDTFVTRSECGDLSTPSPYQASGITQIEVYRFPEDCLSTELADHFSTLTSCSLTDKDIVWNADTKTFILELPSHDVESILEQPEQLLEDDDEMSMIKIRRYVTPSTQLLVTGEKPLNDRTVKKFSNVADVKACSKAAHNDGQYIVTLASAQEAKKLAEHGTLSLTANVKVKVELYYGPPGSSISSSLRSTSTLPEHSDSPMSATSTDDTPTTSAAVVEPQAVTPRVRPVPRKRLLASDTSPCLLQPSHIEIEQLADLPAEDMYSLLYMQFCDVLGEKDYTKVEHSYDPHKEVFRFDMSGEDIEKILGSKQVLIEEEENSVLCIRPLYTGAIVILKVLKNPGKVGLGKSNLTKCFGEGSPFASSITFLRVTRSRADVKMESCSVASRVVSLGQHTLDNKIVLSASFPSAADESVSDKGEEESAPNVVLVETKMSRAVLAKFIKSKSKGNLTENLGDGRYLVEYGSGEAAQAVLDQQVLSYMGTDVHVKPYTPDEEEDDEEGAEEPQPSHVEIKMLPKTSAQDMHQMLISHIKKVTRQEVSASLEQSYDEPKQIFRFDLSPEDISTLTSTTQYLNSKDKKTKLAVTSASTGHNVVIKPCRGVNKNLSKTQVKAAFGPKSTYSSKLEIVSPGDREMELAFDSCSVAALIVSKRRHQLKNGMMVEVSFQGESAKSSSSSSQEESEEEGLAEEESIPSGERPIPTQSKKTLLISNLLDVDEEIIYFWVKSLLSVWPRSVQLSADGENAIVKVQGDVDIDRRTLNERCSRPEFLVRGERLSVSEMPPTTALQVISSTSQANTSIDQDTLDSFFSNPKYTGVKNFDSLKSVRSMGMHNELPVHIITYASSQDVECVLQRKPLQFGNRWKFDVAEFYPDVGVCGQDSLFLYRNHCEEPQGSASSRSPVLLVNNVDERQVGLDTLKLFMSNRKRTNGGDIDTWLPKSGSTPGFSSIKIVYTEPGIAERVYDVYLSRGLRCNNVDLELELDIPWLTELHDDHKLRIFGLGSEVDPEKLKFYLCAVSSNPVNQLFFDQLQKKAVAVFQDAIDYGRILDQTAIFSLKDHSQLRVQQDLKTKDLIAKGSRLTKDDLEIPLESILSKKFHRDVEVRAEELPGTTDMWKITTEPQALEYILNESKLLPRCESLAPYSDFLGLHVTSGGQKKTEDLSNLVSDPLMLQFFKQEHLAYQKLSKYLNSVGMNLTKDGVISLRPSPNTKNDRAMLKNWRSLKSILDKYITDTFSTYTTEQLTQPVYERLSRELPNLVTGQPVFVDRATQVANTVGYHITIIGENQLIARLKMQVLQMIERFDLEIKEESAVQETTVPNILSYQIRYLERISYFRQMIQRHKLNSFSGDVHRQCVTMKGLPINIGAAQKEMFDFLPKVANSKVSIIKTPLFLRVFNTPMAKAAIEEELDQRKLSVDWVVENKTISVYSDDKRSSEAALRCMTDVVWEAQYPPDRDLDEPEKKLLVSAVWQRKKTEIMDRHQPLNIVELGDRPGLSMVGLSASKNIVLEDIPLFFDLNVKRTISFEGIPDRVAFINKFKTGTFRQLEQEHSVTISPAETGGIIEICGTKDNIANCRRSLKKIHDSIGREVHPIDNPSMVQYIQEERSFLETVGLRHSCLVVGHKEDAVVRPDIPPSVTGHGGTAGSRYSVTLPGGALCEVHKGDLPSMACDAIVNAANGDLAHVGGLALAIIRKGGPIIQEECREFVRRNGQLMEGQAFTSSAGSLKCKKVIHGVGPRWRGGHSQEEFLLFQCIDSCLEEVEKHRLQSIAIPPVSTGIFGYPLKEAVKTIVDVVKTRVKDGAYLPSRIVFVDNKDNSLDLFERELKAQFQAHQPKSPLPKPGNKVIKSATTRSDQFTITGSNINILNRINLEIKKGDMSNCEEETLVNSVGNNLDLSSGKVAQALSAKAGPQLQAACSALAPVRSGDVVETDGFQLPCHKIFHCNCPSYQSAAALQALKKIVSKCLALAASGNYRSIAFPAIGTGNLSYPEAEVARTMIEAVMEYAGGNPNSSIKDVKIVIFHLDRKTQKGFDDELQRLGATGGTISAVGAASPQQVTKRDLRPVDKSSILLRDFELLEKPSKNPISGKNNVGSAGRRGTVKGSVNVNNTAVHVIEGDITEHSADVLVNSTDGTLNTNGRVTQALLAKAGPMVRQEIYQIRSHPAQNGIWVGSGGDLSARHLFHVDAQSCRGSNDKWKELMSSCLEKCDEMEITSIAFPALGTGAIGGNPKDMAKVMLQAILKHLSDHPQSSLTRIDVVIFQPKMVDDFVSSMKKYIEKRDPWWTRLALIVSDFFYGGASSSSPAPQEQYDYQRRGTRGASRSVVAHTNMNHGLKLDIYGDTKRDIESCKEEINRRLSAVLSTIVWSDKPTYEEDREIIGKLSDAQVERLQTEAGKLNVKLEIDKRVRNIKIVGLSKQLIKVSDVIVKELKRIEKKVHEKREEVLVARAIQWRYEDATGDWTNFDFATNKALEETYTKNSKAVYKYDTHTKTVKLDLGKMEGTDGSEKFKIERIDRSKPKGFEMPSHWVAPLDIYGEHKVIPGTSEYKRVERNFMATLGNGGSAVLEIKRVQNPLLYQQYILLRKEVAKKLGKQETQVEHCPLWHGTNEVTVSLITAGKFDRGLSGKNATVYGCGSYFAKNASYSAQNTYSQPNAQGHKYIIQTRVITGEYLQGSNQMRAAPYKPNKPTEQYDSVVDNLGNPTIFVVFHDASAYPEYIIKFQ